MLLRFFVLALPITAEIHQLTLNQVAARALGQSPEALLARIEEQKAAEQVRGARDPFIPKIYAGSGLAYSYGFPMSIEGSAPSIVQTRAVASVLNRSQSLHLAQAKEQERGVAAGAQSRREQALAAAVDLFLAAERAARLAEAGQQQIASTQKIAEVVDVRVAEGRELSVESRRAALETAKARQRVADLEAHRDSIASRLAALLGYPTGDRVQPSREERILPELAPSTQEAVRNALARNHDLRRLESAIAAKTLEAEASRAERLPTLDLVAQYGLFAKFNNYEDFFRTFQRHNAQLGVSVQVPLFASTASKARAAQAQLDVDRLRIELAQTKNSISAQIEDRYRDLETATRKRQVSRLDLDLAREQLSIQMARMEEGRATLRDIEQARLADQEKWIAYLESQLETDRARLAILAATGELVAALR